MARRLRKSVKQRQMEVTKTHCVIKKTKRVSLVICRLMIVMVMEVKSRSIIQLFGVHIYTQCSIASNHKSAQIIHTFLVFFCYILSFKFFYNSSVVSILINICFQRIIFQFLIISITMLNLNQIPKLKATLNY